MKGLVYRSLCIVDHAVEGLHQSWRTENKVNYRNNKCTLKSVGQFDLTKPEHCTPMEMKNKGQEELQQKHNREGESQKLLLYVTLT
jgi:hypothetical protein